jgi:AcrR family transcriptional regulator
VVDTVNASGTAPVNASTTQEPGGSEASLRIRLVEAALVELRDGPVDELSLRRVAQAVGVSHQAPYVHFGSKRGFLAAVAGVAGDRAAAAAEARVAAAGEDPFDRLVALAEAYLDWVQQEPNVHDLDVVLHIAKSEHPWLQSAAIRYWNLLHDTVGACQPPGTPEPDVLRRCTITWGVVYGISRLAALDQVPASVPGDAREHVRMALEALYVGWRARGAE